MQRLSFHIIAVIISYFLNGCVVVHSRTVCNRPANLEWQLQPQTAQVKWTLMENICNSMVQCWGDQERTETQKSDVPPTWNLPQICPLEVQFGVKLFVSIDATLDLYGIRILNVSKEDFESCSTAPQSQDQFLCSDDVMNASRQVDPKWLLPGLHYFIASHEGNSQLCKLGLRLNVSVKEQQCQSSPLVRLCSGNGVCRTSFWEDGAYRCQCRQHYSGKFCEKFDACLENPCENEGVCVSNGTTDHIHATYKCLCPPHFTGANCSDVIGRENCDRVCRNGTCLQVSPFSFNCVCYTGHPGKEPQYYSVLHGLQSLLQCWIYNQSRTYSTGGSLQLLSSSVLIIISGLVYISCQVLLIRLTASCSPPLLCRCLPGFSGKSCEVVIDYCSLLSVNCLHQGLCLSVIGGYNVSQPIGEPCANGGRCVLNNASSSTCVCAPGWAGRNCRLNINDCVQHWCQNGATCVDEIDGYSCLCPRGYSGSYCEMDVDNCIGHHCSEHGVCLDQQYNYTCRCELGFQGSYCERETDECKSSPCVNGATCEDVIGGYQCHCPPGFEGAGCELDIDECASSPCKNGATCIDQPGNYHCQCVAPFKVVDGFYCLCNPGYAGVRCDQDIDDCASNMCSNNSTCRDLHLTYECLCVPGWEGEFCQQEIDECSSQPCKNNATCTDLLNSYQCLCPQGWAGVDCSEDVDECDSGPCLNGAQCQESPLPGEFSCTCPPFFSGPLCNMPFDPCDSAHDPCLHNATCLTRSDGTAACRCRPGDKQMDFLFCMQERRSILMIAFVFSCDCEPGFSGHHCEEDINECSSRPCQNGGICQDQVNRFHCNCPAGYFGTLCDLDINECEVSPCLHEAVCINKPGGFKCVCRPGNAGTWCELSIDECVSNPCQNGGSCVDGPNRYQCLCAGGFMGFHCETNTDECMSGPCLHGRCIDGVDVYYCQCELGWTGARCEMNIDCSSSPCLNGGSCVDLVDKYACFCLDGYTGKNCDIDIDICLETPINVTLCLNGGTCLDGQGSNFTCSCPAGFIGDFCEMDVNECCSDPCLHGAICRDLLNGYLCHCRAGWTGLHCELDINECLPQPCNQGMCIQNEPGYGYTCFCRPGFVVRLTQHTLPLFHPSLYPPSSLLPPPLSLSLCGSLSPPSFLCSSPRLKFHAQPPSVPTHPWQPAPTRPWKPGTVPTRPWQPAPTRPWQPVPAQPAQPAPTRPWPPLPAPTRPWQTATTRPRPPLPAPTRPWQTATTRPRPPLPAPTRPWQTATTRPRPPLPAPTRPWQPAPTHSPPPAPTQPPTAPTQPPPPPFCHAALCLNGGTCHELQRPSGALSFYCDCPLHFTGHFCEKDTTIFIPSFNGTSYLELPPLASLLQSPGASADPSHPANDTTVTLYLTVKTRATQGTILYSKYKHENLGDRLLHVFLQDGIPVVKLGCSGVQVLNADAGQTINTNRLTSIRIRYGLPVGRSGGSCMIEIAVDNGTVKRQEESLFQPVALGPIFLGDVPSHRDQPASTREVRGFVGCIRELQVNNKDIYIAGEALGGRNIHNCDTPVCQHLPCRNGGTCVSDAEDWFCECPPLYSGRLCQFTACEWSPCGHGATCIPKSHQEAVCLCPYGRQGLLCDDAINITRARFSGNDEFGYTSFIAYSSIPSLSVYYEFQLKLTFADSASALKDNLILFSGQKGQGIDGDDFFVLGVRNGRIVHKFNLGSGVGTMVSDRLNREIDIHTVNFGRSRRTGWLKVDRQRNRTGSSPGHLAGLNALSQVFVGGYNEYTPELLPLGSRFRNGFQGCIFDLEFRTRRDGKFIALGKPEGHPNSGRSVGQCGVTPCTLVTCRNGGTCVDSGSSVYCQCPFGWKGALCSETVSVCDAEHRPPPLCARGSTCVPLPDGYTCLCPLGTGGLHCQFVFLPFLFVSAMAISDPFFSGNQSSWMSFSPVSIRHRTDLRLQFQTLSPEGILFYTAQHLSARAGDFFCVSLTSGLVQLRYNLGSGTSVLQSTNRVDTSGGTWHTVRAGRTGHQGFLVLDGLEVKQNDTEGGMSTLDVATDLFVGGVSDLSSISTFSVESEPVGFTGGVRELVLNGHDFDLTETGALGGANVGDWDGTACGYKVCQNGGRCTALSGADSDSFMCTCPPRWTGPVCNQSVYCVNNLCQHESLCFSDLVTGSYDCFCPLGWEGRYCDKQVGLSMTTLKFVGKSYLKYRDPKFNTRNLRYTHVSFNFTASGNEGLILWMGRAEHDDDDYLAVGLQAGHLKIAVNLGERLSLPLTFRNVTLCCNKWHYLSISLNSTLIQVFLGDERVLFEDVDPFERYVAMNYGGLLYLGGFELHRNISTVTSGLFTKGFVGDLKDVHLYQDPRQLQFLQNSKGFNVYQSNE
uniref:Protein eyes shut homolog n=1 Tax=Salmo trutta TaxID=8032 RepID=A0A673ZPH0_SALTR